MIDRKGPARFGGSPESVCKRAAGRQGDRAALRRRCVPNVLGYGDGGQYAIGGGYVHASDGRVVYDPEFSPGGRTVYGRFGTWRIGRGANQNLHHDDDWAARQNQQATDDTNRQMAEQAQQMSQ